MEEQQDETTKKLNPAFLELLKKRGVQKFKQKKVSTPDISPNREKMCRMRITIMQKVLFGLRVVRLMWWQKQPLLLSYFYNTSKYLSLPYLDPYKDIKKKT